LRWIALPCDHIPRGADLRRVAKALGRALRPGRHFFFDVNNSLGSERYWSGTVRFEKPGVVVMRNGHNHEASRAWSDAEIPRLKGFLEIAAAAGDRRHNRPGVVRPDAEPYLWLSV
jgi:hypothetical protein